MTMKIVDKLRDKRILIWGYGMEGRSAERFIKSHCEVKSLDIFEGAQDEINEDLFDVIIKSPGIAVKRYNEKYTSCTDLFLEEFSKKVIGITGTKGKSTTSSLMYRVLSECTDHTVLLVGNIGIPCLDSYDRIDDDTVIVFEMSCHQLAHTEVSPHIALFLNLYEDHLDYYGTMEAYFNAKSNITKHQKTGDHLFAGDNVPKIETAAQIHVIKRQDESEPFDMSLKGDHNQFNARFVYSVSTELFDCKDEEVRTSISRFTGLHHRLEFVANKNGTDYYNDSISTIPEATIAAIKSIENTGTVLIGGKDRGIDYDILTDFINEHQAYNYIFMYESGKRIYDTVSSLSCCHYTADLREAVELAEKITEPGKACLLSPAAASYGYFKNFEDRGNTFCRLVKNETTLTFTGDIGFDHYMKDRWKDPELVSEEIRQILADSDHVIINVEGPLVNNAKLVQAKEMRLMHTIDPGAVSLFKDLGADIWNLVNNHIMDAGPEGLKMTLREAGKAGCETLGVGMDLAAAKKPVYLQEAGGIGIFGVGYQRACRKADEKTPGCLSWSDMDSIAEVIGEIKKTCRWCIVVSHGGEEFTALPSPYTRDRYLAYLEMGADIVVGHHPHVPMNYELLKNKAIFYSLGNFIFDTDYQRSQYHTDEGVILKLKLTEEDFSFEGFGLRIDRDSERAIPGDIPTIFTEVTEGEYNKLAPLAAKMFISATKRQQVFLYPDEYRDASEEKWEENLLAPLRSGRVPGEVLDFHIICPLAEKAEEGAWKDSSLEDVKKYILDQM